MASRIYTELAKFILVWVIGAIAATSAISHTTELQPVGAAPYAVGTSTLKLSSSALASMQSAGHQPHYYYGGANISGRLLYITDLLETGGSTFTFSVNVPSDSSLYGSMAGATMTYAGGLFYPTAGGYNNSAFFDQTLPGMHDGSGAVPFADALATYPLIVYSHGTGGNPFDSRVSELASHGYVVVSLFHGDDRFSTNDVEKLALRPLAVKSAIDALQQNPFFKDHIDFDRIGGAGFSYGGTTMLSLLGGRVWLPNLSSTMNFTPTQLVTDDRLLAIAVDGAYMGSDGYGPITFQQFGTNGEGAQYVARPVLANIGANDNFTLAQNVFNRLQGTRYLVKYENEGHTLSTQANVDALNWAVLFLDAYVKQDPQALAKLQSASRFAGNASESLAIVYDKESTPSTPPASSTNCTSSFSAANGSLSIPCVNVGGNAYSAMLGLEASAAGLSFELQSATLLVDASAMSNACLAQFDVSSNQVHLPCVDVGGGMTLWAKLDLSGTGGQGGMLFRLSSYEGMTSNSASSERYTLDVAVTAAGMNIPTVSLTDVPKPGSQEEFCNDESLRDQLVQSATNMGYSGTWSVTSCSFSGSSGLISMSMTVMGMSVPYSATYTYH